MIPASDQTYREYECQVCGDMGTFLVEYASPPNACHRCRRKYPAALLKATYDPFSYAVCVRWNDYLRVIRFDSCSIAGDWITLTREENHGLTIFRFGVMEPWGEGIDFMRGIEINLRDIVWAADCPEGS